MHRIIYYITQASESYIRNIKGSPISSQICAQHCKYSKMSLRREKRHQLSNTTSPKPTLAFTFSIEVRDSITISILYATASLFLSCTALHNILYATAYYPVRHCITTLVCHCMTVLYA